MRILCDRMDVPLTATAAFGDDLIDIAMMEESGLGVAVANANPKVLGIADEVCPANTPVTGLTEPPPSFLAYNPSGIDAIISFGSSSPAAI